MPGNEWAEAYDGLMKSSPEHSTIPRPDVTVAQVVLLLLAQRGKLSFRDIVSHPRVKMLGHQRTENSFYTALARLKRRGSITRTADRAYALTVKGEYAALKAYVRSELVQYEQQRDEEASSANPIRWDGRWRVALFDVPESKRPIRDYVRGVLVRLGFRQFQRSMWMSPYKLPPFLLKLLSDPQLRKYTRVLTTSDIDYDEDLRRQFKLL